MNRILDTILELQDALRDLRAGEARLAGLPDWMLELDAEHAGRRAEIDATKEQAAAASSERRAAEAALGDAQEKLKHYQQQISLVRTQREYAALLQEIDTVKGQIRGLEEQALSSLERAEGEQAKAAELEAGFADLDGRYRAELDKWEQEKPAVAASVDRARGRVEELKSRLPAPVLSRFLRLAERHRGEALAVVKALERAVKGPQVWTCGACNYRVRPQVVVEIRNEGSIVECDGCKRILVVEVNG